ncbi:DUF4920 domain-containing protein [Reichenbachiella carrageenanivorans]|uniref:DUF4920 domain-containing protein n=1 Tax=Reichenbachiella carrageenanivorans TaxID=2979869 RepID=A0ABY6D397_9BACT|nr:DUF4920 domain-containing protein [Reichenbachiella carrageenanivorans]UXX80621.1 DUF4920 domain-containing protein [Reichenbachiella carrageenanivorans]
MKNVSLLFLGCVLIFSCWKNEPKQQPQTSKVYGKTFDPTAVSDISNLPKLMSKSDSVWMTLSGPIEKTCAVKGCWMQLKTDQDDPLRVTFKDYGFFVPKNGEEGKTATVQGYCIKQETSVAELQHYAQDAGASEADIASITEPQVGYNFVATGVIIRD